MGFLLHFRGELTNFEYPQDIAPGPLKELWPSPQEEVNAEDLDLCLQSLKATWRWSSTWQRNEDLSYRICMVKEPHPMGSNIPVLSRVQATFVGGQWQRGWWVYEGLA